MPGDVRLRVRLHGRPGAGSRSASRWMAPLAHSPAAGQASAVGGTPPPWWDIRGDHVRVHTPAEVLYHEVSPELTAWSVTRVSAHSLAAFGQPLTNAGWKPVPSTYVVCEQDRAIPPSAHEAMAQRAGAVLRMDTGHSPFLSQPEALAGLLRPILDRAG